ncbi:MAG: TIGR02680 family protein [Planctomycetes bacterium]|nr:TIGR02680 family protein [Planctomycetota bacterium]
MSEVVRFKPARAGIINLWNYLNDEFAFADGRLVLRGHNGAGKTKALEVLFPFVLDGRTEPRRLDPYSTDAKSMWDNLLYRGLEAAYGYVWMEFVRNAPDEPERVCVGVGLRAQRHTKHVKTWFFVTDKVLGRDFQLVDADSRPLSAKGLCDAIGKASMVETALEYRRRIDERLFGLGDRYDGMISLCLMLRKPKIGDGLDPRALSQLLSLGLRQLDDELLDQAARSFEDLETVQRELEHLNRAHRELEAFLNGYRGYARAVARHRAEHARRAMGAVGEQERALQQLADAVEEARVAVSQTETRLARVRAELAAERARLDALKDSQAFKAAGQLTDLENHVRDATGVEQTTREEHELAARAVRELQDQVREAGEQLQATRTEVANAADRVQVTARTCGIEWTDVTRSETAADVTRRLRFGLESRRQDLAHVRPFVIKLAEATQALSQAERAHEAAAADHERALGEVGRRETGVVAAKASLVDELGRWSSSRPSGLLEEEDLASVVTAVARLGEDDAPTLAEVLGRRFEARRQQLSVEQADVDRVLAENDRARVELEAQREAILAEREDAPVASPARPAPRAGRPGAPLWRLVRFRSGLHPGTQAGIEAALEGAGLLDAWVSPSGDLPDPGVFDAFLLADSERVEGSTLADVLEPEDGTDVAPARITSLLRSIGFGASGVVRVGDLGQFQLGPLAGAYFKPAPQFIGATARAEHRRQRLAKIENELRGLAGARLGLEARLAELVERVGALGRAVEDLPTSAGVLTAVRAAEQARGALRSAREAESVSGEAVSRARRLLADGQARLARESVARRLPSSPDEIAEVGKAVERCARDGEALVGVLRVMDTETKASARLQQQFAGRSADVRRLEGTLRDQQQQREALEVRLATLRSTRGVEIEAVMKSVTAAEANIGRLSRDEKGAESAHTAAVGTEAGTKAKLGAAEETVAAAQKARSEALGRTLPFARPELAAVLQIPFSDAERALAHAGRSSGEPAVVAALGDFVEALEAATKGVSSTDERRKPTFQRSHLTLL